MIRSRRVKFREAELDITSFMNLMIILVPVLLMSMVFSHITVLNLKLPDLAPSGSDQDEKKQLELVIRDDYMDINYPQGILLKRIEKKPVTGGENETDQPQGQLQHDFATLSLVLQEVKRQLKEKDIEKRDILLLSEPDTEYQTIVTAMDTARSFKAVVAASVVNAELFPEVSLGDAPAGTTVSKTVASAP